MEAQAYYESLLAQGYPSEEAEKYTREHYPEFSLAPTAPAPVMIDTSAPMPMGAGTPAPMPMPGPGLTGMPIQAGAQQVIIQQSNKGRVWRWFNGIFGIIFSLAMLWVSNFIRETWDVLGDEISKEIENMNFLEKALIGDFVADVESMISTFSTIYTIVMIISVGMLVVSIIQFMNKPWGGKAFLGVAGLLLVVLLGAAIYEYTAINNLIDEVNEMDGDEDLENIEFMETPGFIGSACTSVCFLIFALLAFLGRPRGAQVVQLQM
jgi:drug/metabolite transporter superfamily protein YnfA